LAQYAICAGHSWSKLKKTNVPRTSKRITRNHKELRIRIHGSAEVVNLSCSHCLFVITTAGISSKTRFQKEYNGKHRLLPYPSKFTAKIRVWGAILLHGTSRLHIVKVIMNQTKYVRVLDGRLLPWASVEGQNKHLLPLEIGTKNQNF